MAFYLCKEAGAGIEPTNSGFADRCLTTWLPRHYATGEYERSAKVSTKWPFGQLRIWEVASPSEKPGGHPEPAEIWWSCVTSKADVRSPRRAAPASG